MSEISICIPTYEYGGKGIYFLSKLLDSIEMQTFKDFNIVISDHSRNEDIMNFCRDSDYDFEFTYIKNVNGRGYQASNTNCALEYAEGRIIKLIYQDDIFIDTQALEKIKRVFDESDCKWIIHGFSHTSDGIETYRDCVPKWCDMMLEGRNLLGSPSCFAVLNEYKMYMDENIKLLIDTELYHRMRCEYGMPYLIEDILIANREHDDRLSSGGITYDCYIEHPEGGWMMNKSELNYVRNKHINFYKNGSKYPDEI